MLRPRAVSNSVKILQVQGQGNLSGGRLAKHAEIHFGIQAAGTRELGGVRGYAGDLRNAPAGSLGAEGRLGLAVEECGQPRLLPRGVIVRIDGGGTHNGSRVHQIEGVILHRQIAVPGAAPGIGGALRLSAVGSRVISRRSAVHRW